MTNDADYELWAAMMADDEPVVAKEAPVVQPQVITQAPPAPINEPPKFFQPTPVVVVAPELQLPEVLAESEELDEDDVEFSASLFKEPQTNSIIVPEVPDALTADIVTESGEILKTGAIDMPILNNTGSIPIITIVPDEVDEEAISADMGDETTGGIPPIRSGSVMNSSARVGVLPIKNRRSEGQTILLATTSILLVALGAGLIAANWLGLL
jgi:hypothetical protein